MNRLFTFPLQFEARYIFLHLSNTMQGSDPSTARASTPVPSPTSANHLPSPTNANHLHPDDAFVRVSMSKPTSIMTAHITDDGYESTLSSPTSAFGSQRPYSSMSSSPLLSSDPEITGPRPREPPASLNPPAYRMTALPPYSPWGDKYQRLDVESGRIQKTRYGLGFYSWRVWASVVIIILLTIVAIVIAVLRTVGSGPQMQTNEGGF
jgi:hypothetical protein